MARTFYATDATDHTDDTDLLVTTAAHRISDSTNAGSVLSVRSVV
jgi:hypothetical protein